MILTRPICRLSGPLLLIAALASATPAFAQPGWGRSGWDRSGWDRSGWGASRLDRPRAPAINSGRDLREGKVEAAQFTADDARDALGHGTIALTTVAGAIGDVADSAPYEAATIDRLVKAGYDTLVTTPDTAGQIVEIRVVRDVLVPEERRRKPVSGEAMVGTGTHGSMMGLALNLDLSKPDKALISTRLEARVLDRESGRRLWEGRAEIATREGDSRWGEQAIAERLTEALFDRFPAGGAQLSAG